MGYMNKEYETSFVAAFSKSLLSTKEGCIHSSQRNDPGMADISTELELISSSLLPCEALNQNEGDSYTIISTDSLLSIAFELGPEYPARDSVKLEIKGEIGREEGEGWRIWIGETMESWVEDSE